MASQARLGAEKRGEDGLTGWQRAGSDESRETARRKDGKKAKREQKKKKKKGKARERKSIDGDGQ